MKASEIAWNIVTFPRTVYRETWLPFLFWFNKTRIMGGRAKAGERGRLSRIVRLLGNALILVGLFAGIAAIGASIWFTGGAAIPAWAGLLMFIGMSANFLALPVGSSGNTVKMQQRYDYERLLQLQINEKAVIDQEPPHGMQDPLMRMTTIRYLHDVNGAAGSLATLAAKIIEIIGMFTSVAMPVIGNILFLGARASGLISVTGATLTNPDRSSAHNKIIAKQINMYYDLCGDRTPDLHVRVDKIINFVFNHLKINGDDKYYGTWVRFHCYRAVERMLQTRPLASDTTISACVHQYVNQFRKPHYSIKEWALSFLKNVTEPPPQNFKLDREKLRGILNQNKTPSTKENGISQPKNPEVCVLDSMAYFEERLYHKLQTATQKYPVPRPIDRDDFAIWGRDIFVDKTQEYNVLFLDYLKSHFKIRRGNKDKLIQLFKEGDLAPYFKKVTESTLYFNTKKMREDWPIDTSHGNQFIASHQLKRLANMVKEKYFSASTTPQISFKEIAVKEIWLPNIREVGDDRPEGDYDDHNPMFHAVRTFCLKYVIKQLEEAKPEDLDAVKQKLREKVKILITQLTKTSRFSPVKKLFMMGYKYFDEDKLKSLPEAAPAEAPTNSNTEIKHPLTIPEYRLGAKVYGQLAMAA